MGGWREQETARQQRIAEAIRSRRPAWMARSLAPWCACGTLTLKRTGRAPALAGCGTLPGGREQCCASVVEVNDGIGSALLTEGCDEPR